MVIGETKQGSRGGKTALWAVGLVIWLAPTVRADEGDLAERVARGVAIVEQGARNYPSHRKCFSCHHQTLPLLAMQSAADAKFKIDESLVKSQTEFTTAHFTKRQPALLRGERTDGAAITVAYGLWTLEIVNAPASDLSDAMVVNLLALQAPDGHWRPQSIRPPLAESLVSCTVLSAYGLQKFARGEQQTAAQAAIKRANEYLASAKLVGTEDLAFRLWGLQELGGQPAEIDRARQALIATQRADGGWSQLPHMQSDAYATGQALFLLQAADLPVTSRVYERGVAYLRGTQAADGSWHVVTRARPVQTYFDNGDPYEKDQFISMAATSWATAALAKAAIAKPTLEKAYR